MKMTRVEKLRLKREAHLKKSKQKQEPNAKRRKERKPYKIVEGYGHISLDCFNRLRGLKSS